MENGTGICEDIDTFISYLQEIKKEHGNIQIRSMTYDNDGFYTEGTLVKKFTDVEEYQGMKTAIIHFVYDEDVRSQKDLYNIFKKQHKLL